MARIGKIMIVSFVFLLMGTQIFAQCESWIGSPKEGEASDAHTIYRDHMKNKAFDAAFEYWQKAYTIAPAADGKRDFHYTDGIKIYKHKMEKDPSKKAEYIEKIIGLYNQDIDCFKSGAIKMGKITPEERIGYLKGRLGYDMYYSFQTPYETNLATLKEAVDIAGDKTEYIVLTPYANIVVYQFLDKKLDKKTARDAYETLNKIADNNINGGSQFKDQYKQAKAAMNAEFAKIEDHIFDADYFVKKYEPRYESAKNDPAQLKEMIGKLKQLGCDPNNAFLKKLEGDWAQYASAENARLKAEFEKNNPASIAKKLYDSGDYSGAIAKYREAMSKSSDNDAKANYLFRIASIQGRKMKSYNKARSTARQAAKMKPNWGRPFMLIGDLYAMSSRSCGDSFMQRCAILAALDKYSYAKSIDSSVASEANSRIAKYNKSRPAKADAFMQGKKAGDSIKISCWIGETVKLRFAN